MKKRKKASDHNFFYLLLTQFSITRHTPFIFTTRCFQLSTIHSFIITNQFSTTYQKFGIENIFISNSNTQTDRERTREPAENKDPRRQRPLLFNYYF